MPKGKPKRSATKKRGTKGAVTPAKKPASESKAAKATAESPPPPETEAKPANAGQAAPPQRSQYIVTSLAAVLLVLFVVIAFFAPDPTSPQGHPSAQVLLWRLLFLLLPLGIMYSLLWGAKALTWLRR